MVSQPKQTRKYPIRLLAGRSVYRKIQAEGLQPTDIGAVFGASGAAKWLSIAGLDAAIFSSWLSRSTQTILLYGTSIGAMKLAAAAQTDCSTSLLQLADAYANQRYGDDVSVDAVSRETRKVFDIALDKTRQHSLLNQTRYRYYCSAVHCKGLLASPNGKAQVAGMLSGAARAALGKPWLAGSFERVIFGPEDDAAGQLIAADGTPTHYVNLTESNVLDAITASGSIPVYMKSVSMQSADREQLILRDGGLLDYHPIASNFVVPSNGIVLYPHFYPTLTEGWFDKHFPWRRKHQLSERTIENTLLITPSETYINLLPNAKIPGREDFKTYYRQDDVRIGYWREAIEQSKRLGDAWLDIAERNAWGEVLELID